MTDQMIDVEAEKCILSAMINSERACIESLDMLNENDFNRPLHKTMFGILGKLFSRGVVPTFAEVIIEAHKNDIARRPDDIQAMGEIANQFIDDVNIEYWIERVKSKSKLRGLAGILRKYGHHLQTPEKVNVDNLLADIEGDLADLTLAHEIDKIQGPKEIANSAADELDKKVIRLRKSRENNPGVMLLDGVTTGLPTLDNHTLGYKPGDLILVGAESGKGKTAFALNTASKVAVSHRNPMLYINTEMANTQINFRMAAILSGVKYAKILKGDLDSKELNMVMQSFASIDQSGFHHYYAPNLTPQKLMTMARKAKIQSNIKFLILDYIGRMDKTSKEMTEWQMLEQIVKTLKILAQNLEIAVMCLVQLNENLTVQGTQRMRNEADMLFKLLPLPQDKAKDKGYNYELAIDKSRDSLADVSIPLIYDKTTQRIREFNTKRSEE